MAGRPQRFELRLTTQERVRLEKLIASSETASRLRQRARVILLRADGKTYDDIEKELAISTPTIAKILKKCFAYGVDEALGDLDRTGRNDVIDADAKAWLVSLACQFPEDVPEGPEQERWTITALTDYVQRHCAAAGYASLENVRSSTVWNILNDPTAKPRHLDYCLECRDESPLEDKKQILLLYKRMELVPKFERDALGTGFCAVEPEGAAYSAVMQAVTLASVPDPQPPGPRQAGDERFSVLTGTDMQTGSVFSLVREDYTGDAFVEFLKQADRRYPQRYDIVLVLEKCWIYRTKEVLEYLAGCRKGRFHFVCEHKNAFWLNLVECFLTKLTRHAFAEMRAPDKKTLIREVARWLVELNHEPVAFRWPGSSQEIARVLCIDV